MTASIIIPAFKEYDNLQRNIPYLSARFPQEDIHIIENGSEIAPDFGFLDNVRVSNIKTKGLGAALRYGILTAQRKVVVFLPADLSYDLRFVRESEAIINAGWDLVIGSKWAIGSEVHRPLFREEVSLLYNAWWNLVYRLRITDITGVKAYNRDSIKWSLTESLGNGINFEVNLLRKMRTRKMKIIEIPVTVKDFHPSKFVPWELNKA